MGGTSLYQIVQFGAVLKTNVQQISFGLIEFSTWLTQHCSVMVSDWLSLSNVLFSQNWALDIWFPYWDAVN